MTLDEKPGLDAVRKFLKERGEGPDGLTAETLSARTVESEDPEHLDCVVFEVKREKILTDSFHRCPRPVEVVVTSWSKYSFNPEAKTLEKLNNHSAPSILTDWPALVEDDVAKINFSFRRLGIGHIICNVDGPSVKEEWRVVGFDGLEQHLQDIAVKLRYEDLAMRIVRRAGAGDPVTITKRLQEEFCRRAMPNAWLKWINCMGNMEVNSGEGE